ncbi:MAG: hypothetical protein DHS20C16_19390 [Phycisphaerae bacterium]|nr:MAG: hypothetical protein DHS20C16_19390 [Phycisphaerae bacterium]
MKLQIIWMSLITLLFVSPAKADIIVGDIVGRISAFDIAWMSQNGINHFSEGDIVVISFTSLLDDVDVDDRETRGEYPNAIQEVHLSVGSLTASASSGSVYVGDNRGSSNEPYDAFSFESAEFDEVSGLPPGFSMYSVGAIFQDDTSTMFDSDSLTDAWDALLTTSDPFMYIEFSLWSGLGIGITPEIIYQNVERVIPEPSSGVLVAAMFFWVTRRSRRQALSIQNLRRIVRSRTIAQEKY